MASIISLVNSSPFGINNVHVWERTGDFIADGIKQVRLAQPGVSIDKQRVVKRCRLCGNGHGGSVGKFVGGADDEGVKGKFIILGRRLGISC